MANAERQRGSVTIEMVILFPVVLGLLFAAVQTGLWFHARNIALTSAQEGARVAAMYESSSAAGRAAAVDFATTAGERIPASPWPATQPPPRCRFRSTRPTWSRG